MITDYDHLAFGTKKSYPDLLVKEHSHSVEDFLPKISPVFMDTRMRLQQSNQGVFAPRY